jgi:hypothetical protein
MVGLTVVGISEQAAARGCASQGSSSSSMPAACAAVRAYRRSSSPGPKAKRLTDMTSGRLAARMSNASTREESNPPDRLCITR